LENTAGQGWINWNFINLTEETLSVQVIYPGQTNERQSKMAPGTTLVAAQKVPGENNLVVHWTDAVGQVQTVTSPGVNFVVTDLTGRYVTAPNSNYLDWDVTHPNSFNMKIDWVYEKSGRTGPIYLNKETTMPFRTPREEGALILSWPDEYGNTKSITLLNGSQALPPDSAAAQTALTITFVESSASTGYLNWIITNPNSTPVTYYMKISGDTQEKKLLAQPGENKVSRPKVPGENSVDIRW
jgi:hypothetical protein